MAGCDTCAVASCGGEKDCSTLQNLLSLIAALKLKSDKTNTAATTRGLLAALEDGDEVRDWPLDPSEIIETRPPFKNSSQIQDRYSRRYLGVLACWFRSSYRDSIESRKGFEELFSPSVRLANDCVF
ncbi:hypothetical protein IFM61606_08908 [Aspergillus udagawae]|uniref:Uncharacterized protein n=1 Tax=Aspergillus udagawae TaxID=91492 RepID=A0ABQ1B108_9EURO|nr:hypothetical protein IFM61606_08908 [Aspergillus udagawae]GFF46608.1 hypothetical protein IFM51744_06359 [Aspergillus udagawae]GFF91736.1 hypothetical protein IFM53868_06605 [Aspergillus udagawae]GFG07519.1 hypothetical protein IFM5058_03461 [Aspergillus udagawae]